MFLFFLLSLSAAVTNNELTEPEKENLWVLWFRIIIKFSGSVASGSKWLSEERLLTVQKLFRNFSKTSFTDLHSWTYLLSVKNLSNLEILEKPFFHFSLVQKAKSAPRYKVFQNASVLSKSWLTILKRRFLRDLWRPKSYYFFTGDFAENGE